MTTRTHRPGTYSGYNWHMEQRKRLDKAGRPLGKRHKICPPCRAANTRQMDKYRKKRFLNRGLLKVPIIGTQRRLHALQALGWNYRDLGKMCGKDGSMLSNLANDKNRETVLRETAEKIAALYNEISTPEDSWLTRRTMKQARERGYVVPFCWDEIDDPYALPVGLSHIQAYNWFWNAATMRERIEWVLQRGEEDRSRNLGLEIARRWKW